MDFFSLVPVLLPIALFVVTMIIIFTLRAGDKSSRSLSTVKKLLDKYKGDVEASDNSFKQYAAELEQTISKKDSEVKELIQTINSQLGELRSYSEDLVRLKMAMDTYREALEGLARLTSDADDKISTVQNEVDRLDKVRNVIDGFRQDMRDADEHLRKHEQRVIQLERESIGRMNTAVSETDSSMDEAMEGLHKESMEIFEDFKEKTDKDTEFRLRKIDDAFQSVIHTVQEFFGELENKLDVVRQQSSVLEGLIEKGSEVVSSAPSIPNDVGSAPSVVSIPNVTNGIGPASVATHASGNVYDDMVMPSFVEEKPVREKPSREVPSKEKPVAEAVGARESKPVVENKSFADSKPSSMDVMDVDYGYDAHGVSDDSMDDYGNPQWETYGEEEVVDFDDDPNDVPNDDLT